MRSRGSRTALLAAASTLVAACAIPARDNAQDPARRPAPLLLVADVSKADGSCPCGLVDAAVVCDAPLSGPSVGAASRGRCLALDARQSSDPDEGSPDLEFRWFLRTDGADEELVSPADGLLATNGLFLLSAPTRASLPLEAELTFVVRAEDRAGHYARDETTLTVFNSRPVVRAPSTRTYPFGGFPWLADVPGGAPPFEVDFRADGRVTDADPSDSEHHVFCWTIGADPEVCHRDGSHQDFSRSLPAGEATVISAYLRVSDWPGVESEAPAHPETFSNVVRTRVTVGAPPLWLRDSDGTFGLQRLDPVHETKSVNGVDLFSNAPIFATAFGEDLAVIRTSAGTQLSLIAEPVPPVPPFVDLPFAAEVFELLGDAAHDRLWVVYAQSSPGDEPLCDAPPAGAHMTLRAFSGSLVEQVCVHLPFHGEKPRPVQLALAEDGAMWALERFGGDVVRVAAAPGSQVEVFASAGPDKPMFLDVARRPGTDEMWLVARSVPFSSPMPPSMSAMVVEGSTSALLEEYDLQDEGTVFGPWWVDTDRFWTFTEGEGLRLVDARVFQDGLGMEEATVAAATISGIPDMNAEQSELPDPVTGGLWARIAGNPNSKALFASPLGGAVLEYDVAKFHPQFVDDQGALWHSYERSLSSYVLERGIVPGNRGVVASVPALTIAAIPDLDGGGVWTGGILSPGLSRYAENGELIEAVTQYVDAQTNVAKAVPPIALAQISADSSHAWLFGFLLDTLQVTDLYSLDLTAGTGRIVVPDLMTSGIEVFAASAPLPGAMPFAWTTRSTGGDLMVQKLYDGGFDPVLASFAASEYGSMGAVSLRTNALCLATYDSIASELVMRRILDDGTVHELGRFAGNSQPTAVAVSHDPEDFCWVRATDMGGAEQVLGWADDGDSGNAPDRTFAADLPSFVGEVKGLYAVSPDEIWVSLLDDSGPFTRTARFRFLTSSTVSIEVDYVNERAMELLPLGLSHSN